MTTGKSTEEFSPPSKQSLSRKDNTHHFVSSSEDVATEDDATGTKKLAPGEVVPEDPLEIIENLSAEELLLEVTKVQVSGDVNATNVPYRQCLDLFSLEISNMIRLKKTFIDDLRTLDPSRLHQEILRQMLKHPQAAVFVVWMRDNAQEVIHHLRTRPVESFPSFVIAAFTQHAAFTYKTIEIQFVNCLFDLLLPVFSRFISDRTQSVKDEPVITCNFVIEGLRMQNVSEPSPNALRSIKALDKFLEGSQGKLLMTLERSIAEGTADMIMLQWSLLIISFCYELGYVYQPSVSSPLSWSVTDVGIWLRSLRMPQFIAAFEHAGVDGRALLEMTSTELQVCLEIENDDLIASILENVGALIKQENHSKLNVKAHTRWTLSGNSAAGFVPGFKSIVLTSVQNRIRTGRQLWRIAINRVRFFMRKVTALESYLKGATKAEILALTHMELHPRDAKLLNDFLSLSPYVRKLELNGNHLSKAGMSIITPSLKASRTLTILSISGNGIGDEGALCAAIVIRNCIALVDIDLGSNGIGDKGGRSIARAAGKSATLRNCLLYSNRLTHVTAAAIAESLAIRSEVLYDLSENPLKSRGVASISTVIGRCWTQRRFDVRGCECLAKGVQYLGEALKLDREIQFLYLSSNPFGPEGCVHLMNLFEKNFALINVDISGCNIGDDGVKLVMKGLVLNKCIRYIDLADNNITDVGTQYIAAFFLHQGNATMLNPASLDRMTLGKNPITHQGLGLIAAALNKSKMCSLEFPGCAIDDDGPRKLANAIGVRRRSSFLRRCCLMSCLYFSGAHLTIRLQSNTRVKLIDLSANSISADGVWIMAQKGLIKNTTLEQLNISDNRIQDSGARALATALESNMNIELLNITGNGIADEGVSVLMSVVLFLFSCVVIHFCLMCYPLALRALPLTGITPGAY
jgi:Ran GTPase-activating protein (RanGAP) involved in mRNA processing and transport